jgi:hypothetical protein
MRAFFISFFLHTFNHLLHPCHKVSYYKTNQGILRVRGDNEENHTHITQFNYYINAIINVCSSQ